MTQDDTSLLDLVFAGVPLADPIKITSHNEGTVKNTEPTNLLVHYYESVPEEQHKHYNHEVISASEIIALDKPTTQEALSEHFGHDIEQHVEHEHHVGHGVLYSEPPAENGDNHFESHQVGPNLYVLKHEEFADVPKTYIEEKVFHHDDDVSEISSVTALSKASSISVHSSVSQKSVHYDSPVNVEVNSTHEETNCHNNNGSVSSHHSGKNHHHEKAESDSDSDDTIIGRSYPLTTDDEQWQNYSVEIEHHASDIVVKMKSFAFDSLSVAEEKEIVHHTHSAVSSSVNSSSTHKHHVEVVPVIQPQNVVEYDIQSDQNTEEIGNVVQHKHDFPQLEFEYHEIRNIIPISHGPHIRDDPRPAHVAPPPLQQAPISGKSSTISSASKTSSRHQSSCCNRSKSICSKDSTVSNCKSRSSSVSTLKASPQNDHQCITSHDDSELDYVNRPSVKSLLSRFENGKAMGINRQAEILYHHPEATNVVIHRIPQDHAINNQHQHVQNNEHEIQPSHDHNKHHHHHDLHVDHKHIDRHPHHNYHADHEHIKHHHHNSHAHNEHMEHHHHDHHAHHEHKEHHHHHDHHAHNEHKEHHHHHDHHAHHEHKEHHHHHDHHAHHEHMEHHHHLDHRAHHEHMEHHHHHHDHHRQQHYNYQPCHKHMRHHQYNNDRSKKEHVEHLDRHTNVHREHHLHDQHAHQEHGKHQDSNVHHVHREHHSHDHEVHHQPKDHHESNQIIEPFESDVEFEHQQPVSQLLSRYGGGISKITNDKEVNSQEDVQKPYPIAVASVPQIRSTPNNNNKFESVRVVKNVRQFINEWGHKDFTPPTSPIVVAAPRSIRSISTTSSKRDIYHPVVEQKHSVDSVVLPTANLYTCEQCLTESKISRATTITGQEKSSRSSTYTYSPSLIIPSKEIKQDTEVIAENDDEDENLSVIHIGSIAERKAALLWKQLEADKPHCPPPMVDLLA